MADEDFPDDPTIPDDAELWRRVPSQWCVFDENVGEMRPSSGAFDDSSDGSPMSVILADAARDPHTALAGQDNSGLVAITAGLARSCGLRVAHDPLDDEPAHVVVAGKKTRSVKRKLVDGATWVIPPPISAGS